MTVTRSEFTNKRVAVLGTARTGTAVATVLREHGANVFLSDSLGVTELGRRMDELEKLGVNLRVEAAPEDALADAEIVIPSPGIRRDSKVLKLAVQMGIPIYSEIEAAYRISRAPMIAITGTNGKTTTTMLMGEIFKKAGRRAWVAGNIAADEVKQTLITAAHLAEPTDTIIAEISSFQLEWVEQFRPRIGILTNITPDHLNRHESFAEYCAAKERLFTAQNPDDVAVLNAVNVPARQISGRVKSRVYWFDRGNCETCCSACVQDGEIVVRWDCVEYRLGRVENLKIPGTHNLENVLAAAGAAIAYGIDPEAVSAALHAFRGVVHRMEPVAEIDGVAYINNSMCTNVDAAVRSLEAIGKPTVVIAGGVNKNSDFTTLGEAIARHARHLVLIGQAAPDLEEAARRAGFSHISNADSMESAVLISQSMARFGDVVMLSPACASFDMFVDFEARGEAFRQAVRKIQSTQ